MIDTSTSKGSTAPSSGSNNNHQNALAEQPPRSNGETSASLGGGSGAPTATELAERPTHVIGRLLEPNGDSSSSSSNGEQQTNLYRNGNQGAMARPQAPPVALFCYDGPDGYIGKHVAAVAAALARRGRVVHLFCRQPFVIPSDAPVHIHAVGQPESNEGILEQAQEFCRRAGNAFMKEIPAGTPVGVVGYEWASAGVLSLLKGLRNQPGILSLHSLERQRSDLSNETSRRIVEIEYEGMQTAQHLVMHDPTTIEVTRRWVPACLDKVIEARSPFPVEKFETIKDPGQVKSRYQVGPTDPVLLFIGDLNEQYGPELILRAMPALLRHHPQARLIIVGDGQMFWPLRVFARYLLLEYAIRLVGDVQGQNLHDLIQASDIIVVPSRQATPWWPIQAAWAARKPVVATHDAARELTEHEKDAVLIYPSENSVVWGVERVLYDEGLRKSLGEMGRAKLEERFGWNCLAEQLDEILAGVAVAGAGRG